MSVAAWLLYALCYAEGDETWSRDFAGGPVVKTSCLGAWVQILVEELRSHRVRGSARKKETWSPSHAPSPSQRESCNGAPAPALPPLGLPVGVISSECTRGTPPATQIKKGSCAV